MTQIKKYKVGIIGATGYTGCELMRLLHEHKWVDLQIITARSAVGEHPSKLFPNLFATDFPLVYSDINIDLLSQCDFVFFATPHTVAMTIAPQLLEKGVKVIDLSADFRLPNIKIWEQNYKTKHTATNWVKNAVYGLANYADPKQLKKAPLVAVAGCYPTASMLGILPFLQNNLISPNNIIIDAKSGISGAGRSLNANILFAEINENFAAYAMDGHRHLPEITHWLEAYGGQAVKVTFVPHLVPMIRGMEVTIYAQINPDQQNCDFNEILQQHYKNSANIHCLPAGTYPQTKAVRGTNAVQIAVAKCSQNNQLIITVTIDNLMKGASGQAVEIMNICADLPVNEGLKQLAIWP